MLRWVSEKSCFRQDVAFGCILMHRLICGVSDLPHDWWALDPSVQLRLELFGALVAQCTVSSPAIVPAFDPLEDAGRRLGSGRVMLLVHQLALERAPEALGHRVVVAVAAPAHAAGDPAVVQQLAVG